MRGQQLLIILHHRCVWFLTETEIYCRLFSLVAAALFLVTNPAGAIVNTAAERATLCEATLHLPIRARTVNVVADAKLLHGSDLFVLLIQARTSDALLEEACAHQGRNTTRLFWANSS